MAKTLDARAVAVDNRLEMVVGLAEIMDGRCNTHDLPQAIWPVICIETNNRQLRFATSV